MFHGRPLNQSGVFVPQTSQQQQQSWPLTQQEHNNLRASQSGSSPSVQVKFYLPDDEIRRSQIPANCTLQQVTEQIKRYASVADKNLLLAWNDDQNEWIRFDTDSEFNDAMNHARHLLSVNGVFKIQAKEGKTPTKQTTSEPTPVVEQKPIQPPVQPVVQPVQPPIQQPVQPVKPPVTQPPVTQPPVVQPIKPVQPVNPFYPQQPMYTQPPVMSYGQPQPQFQPFAMNPPMMNQPMTQPMSQASMVPRNVSPLATSTPTKTLNNSVTMQQPHPLNSSFSSSSSSVPSQSPVQQLPVNPPLTQPQVVQPQQTANVDEQKLATLRSFGFPVNDSVLIKALQEANGDINLAVGKMLEQ